MALTAFSSGIICGTAPLAHAVAFAECSATSIGNGTCDVSGSLTDDEAILNGNQPGGGGNGNGGNGAGGGGGNAGGGGNGTGNGSGTGIDTGTGNGGGTAIDVGPPSCTPAFRPPGCVDWQVISLVPTLNDIAAFRPTPNVDHMQPNGWFVVGLDANFYATGGASTVDGTLLGQPAAVRFTPIRWTWTYGDGTSATRATRGGTWAALGIREFEATPTSHVYNAAGTYYIDLTVGYRAEYQFDGGQWGTIPGTLWLPANRLVATVGGAKTVLVERDCMTAPPGPGC